MSGRKKRPEVKEEPASAASYYELKTQAVEDLVTANAENSPQVTREEIRKYTSRHRLKLADWVKLLLVKWWFAAMVCYFFLWGLGTTVRSMLDLLVITALALGMVTDLLTNNVLRFVEKRKGANDRWMMYPRKGFWSLPLNLVHAGVILFLVYTAYNALNGALIAMNGLAADAVPLGVEPILFGLLCLGADMALIGLKHGCQAILRDAMKSQPGTAGKAGGPPKKGAARG